MKKIKNKSDLDWESFERLRKYGCPLDWEGLELDGREQEKDPSIAIDYDASPLQCLALPYRPEGGVYYMLNMHITSKAANRCVMQYRLTTEWDEEIFLLTASSYHYGDYYCVPLNDRVFRADEVLNERCGPKAGRFGPSRFLNGMLLGFGMKPIPKGLRAAPVRVWLWDQFDDPFFGDIPAMVDRSHMDKSVPRKGTGLCEPAEEEQPSISERSRIAYLASIAREQRDKTKRPGYRRGPRGEGKGIGRNAEDRFSADTARASSPLSEEGD